MLVAIIPSDINSPIRIENVEPDLQSLVGGDLQMLGIRDLDVSMFLDEEGKFKPGQLFNERATKLAVGSILPHDIIVGDVVLVGPPNSEGDDTDLPDQAIHKLRAVFGNVSAEQL